MPGGIGVQELAAHRAQSGNDGNRLLVQIGCLPWREDVAGNCFQRDVRGERQIPWCSRQRRFRDTQGCSKDPRTPTSYQRAIRCYYLVVVSITE